MPDILEAFSIKPILRATSRRIQELEKLKSEAFSRIDKNDPFLNMPESADQEFLSKFGSFDNIMDRADSGHVQNCIRKVWRDHTLNEEEAAALKNQVEALKQTHASLLKSYPHLAPILYRNESYFREATADLNEPIRVAITGATGNIGYSLLYRLASGDAFGPRTPVIFQLLELPEAMQALQGVEMELRDCAFPNVKDVILTDKPEVAFANVDYALLIGAMPRMKGMERGDLLMKNAEIFSVQGKALNKVGKGKDTRVIVVGNPANTNALIASRNAPKIPAQNFAAMTKLDHTRGLAQLADKTNCSVNDIKKFCIWGNHSATQFPDIAHATIKGQPAPEIVKDDAWYREKFIPDVQQRGAAIIKARGKSSAASAASALIDNVREWHYGTTDWTSVAVSSNGEYGVDKGLFFSYPIVFQNQSWNVVKDLPVSEFASQRLAATLKELKEERDAVASMLPKD